jgi:hypothetical protein
MTQQLTSEGVRDVEGPTGLVRRNRCARHADREADGLADRSHRHDELLWHHEYSKLRHALAERFSALLSGVQPPLSCATRAPRAVALVGRAGG